MKFSTQKDSSSYNVFFPERVTFDDHTEFKTLINQIVVESPRKVTFDLKVLEFMDSSALGMLILAQEMFHESSIGISLKNPKPEILKTLKYSDFDKIFTIELPDTKSDQN